ncbi:hypothetical protein [Lake Baikal phage Baikal-20-5m-C28]|nr:hypothetical protein [Lake Baikal phage Baikal-20-5m-C28]
MEILGGIVIGLLVGVAIPVLWFWLTLVKNIKIEQATSAGLSKFRETVVPSRLEEYGGMLFLYNKETNEYIGQGLTLAELERNVKKRFPEKLFNVKQEEIDQHNTEGTA